MTVCYEVSFEYDNGDLVMTRVFGNTEDTTSITGEELSQLHDLCQQFQLNRSLNLSQQIGEQLFDLMNGDNLLVDAIEEARAYGERLQVSVRTKTDLDFPFELLYHSQFLVPSTLDVVRRISDFGCKKKPEPENQPLKILFVACSPEGVEPVLEYEKEEDTIFKVTENLPVDMDVEDTGSLEGLSRCLEQHEYDVIHITGHADIDDEGPYFCMEDEEGYLDKVRPSQLQEVLGQNSNPPRLIFLSGCRTGQAPEHAAVFSFAHQLVAENNSTVLGWGLPVLDPGATLAASCVYRELSRGNSIANAVFSARKKLFKEKWLDWPLLRLFSDGTPLDVPLVVKGQKKRLKARDIQYIFLEESHVKVLKSGFIGRRRQIQKGIRCLKKDDHKVGLLLHGTGGLGKSCLAGKFCDRFKDHALIIVRGELNTVTFSEALKNGFARTDDERGLKILQEKEEIHEKIRRLCLSSFQKEKYLILLDDFEKNLESIEQGDPVVTGEAAPILGALLVYLPYAGKMSQLIITSRYTFPFTGKGRDLIEDRLEKIGLISFQGADEQKKVSELNEIANYPDTKVREKLVEAGRGNPRLMEDLNTLLEVEKYADIVSLLDEVQGKQEEFVQELVLREILKTQLEGFQRVMQHSAVFGLPVQKEGIHLVCKDLEGWKPLVDLGVQLSLIEEDKRKDVAFYWVTPLLREELFEELGKEEKKRCHQAAVVYYRKVLSLVEGYAPLYAFELIEHALKCGMDDIALKEGFRLLPYLRNTLAYREALSEGEYILSQITAKGDEDLARFLSELGVIYNDVGNSKKAIEYYEKALEIGVEIYGEKHPSVATRLNNLGSAWKALGDPRKAIEYFEKALEIDIEIYGENHPDVAIRLNNLGLAWNSLGDSRKAIEYYEKALSIVKEIYGEKHPSVAKTLSNLGSAWYALGNSRKAIEYYEKALEIGVEIYGENHPDVATRLNNLGGAWDSLGDSKKALKFMQKAHTIFQEFYGDEHPHTKTVKEGLDFLRKK